MIPCPQVLQGSLRAFSLSDPHHQLGDMLILFLRDYR